MAEQTTGPHQLAFDSLAVVAPAGQKIKKRSHPIRSHPRTVRGHTSSAKRTADELLDRYRARLVTNADLTRALVSFQANKKVPFYRWLKYKEAFSHEFVRYILERFRPATRYVPRMLDPFAGAGTALSTAMKSGWRATGIELLPVGIEAMRARRIADVVSIEAFEVTLSNLRTARLRTDPKWRFPHLRITERAFPAKTEMTLGSYLEFADSIKDAQVRELFRFAALTILEDISFTRKDGQYLRWDARSGRMLRSAFDKGTILDFNTAIFSKLEMMRQDLRTRSDESFSDNVDVLEGSCLSRLHDLPDGAFDLILTSPPYCNRYDYTRTYALELAFLGYTEDRLSELRQTLLSATVENKTKRFALANEYERCRRSSEFAVAVRLFESQRAIQSALTYLKLAREKRELNNSNIPVMVENYFFEMNLVIGQFSRLLAANGKVVMVNDNVQYHGIELPVDFILSELAESWGLSVHTIWALPRGKGNSSQQMGVHGRNELRKCVYIWSKN